MVLYYDPLPKKEPMEWRRQGETPPRKFRVCQSTKMVMATIFCDCEGLLLIDFKETNTTVKGKYYAVLLHKLRDNIPGGSKPEAPGYCMTMHQFLLPVSHKSPCWILVSTKSTISLVAQT
jgi:hypothetical protein